LTKSANIAGGGGCIPSIPNGGTALGNGRNEWM